MKNSIKKIIKIKSILVYVVLFFIIFLPFVIYASQTSPPVNGQPGPCPTGQTCINNPFNGGDTLMQLIASVLNNVVMPIAAVVSVCYIIWAGFLYVTAQGKEAEITKAHENLKWSLIGVGVLLGAAGISEVIQKTISSLITPQ